MADECEVSGGVDAAKPESWREDVDGNLRRLKEQFDAGCIESVEGLPEAETTGGAGESSGDGRQDRTVDDDGEWLKETVDAEAGDRREGERGAAQQTIQKGWRNEWQVYGMNEVPL